MLQSMTFSISTYPSFLTLKCIKVYEVSLQIFVKSCMRLKLVKSLVYLWAIASKMRGIVMLGTPYSYTFIPSNEFPYHMTNARYCS